MHTHWHTHISCHISCIYLVSSIHSATIQPEALWIWHPPLPSMQYGHSGSLCVMAEAFVSASMFYYVRTWPGTQAQNVELLKTGGGGLQTAFPTLHTQRRASRGEQRGGWRTHAVKKCPYLLTLQPHSWHKVNVKEKKMKWYRSIFHSALFPVFERRTNCLQRCRFFLLKALHQRALSPVISRTRLLPLTRRLD